MGKGAESVTWLWWEAGLKAERIQVRGARSGKASNETCSLEGVMLDVLTWR